MGSIWGLDMISKRLVVLGVVLIARCVLGDSPEAFAERVFGERPAQQKLWLSGAVKEGMRTAYGGRYPGSSVRYWQQGDQRLWVLKARGKHGFVHAGLITRKGRIVQISVLESKEQRGRMIETSRFLDQFTDARLSDGRKLDQRIDGISGATYSVNAVKKMARAALYLDSCAEAAGE